MKNVLAKSLALAFVGSLFVTGSAMATLIAFDVADAPHSAVSVTKTAGSGTVSADLVTNLDNMIFSLDTGDYRTFDFFTLTVDADFLSVGTAEVEATLAFDNPSIAASGEGGGYYWSICGFISGGGLTWDDSTLPDTFLVGSSTIQVDFEDWSGWGFGNTATIEATVRNLGDSPSASAPVPEPATMMLFGTGMVGLAGFSRRKKSKK